MSTRDQFNKEHKKWCQEVWENGQWRFVRWYETSLKPTHTKHDSVHALPNSPPGQDVWRYSGTAASGSASTNPPRSPTQGGFAPAQPFYKQLPRGRGPRISGTYDGPNTIHFERVDPSYYVRDNGFFAEGKVFSVIMNETAGETASTAAVTDYNTSRSLNRVKYENNIVYTNVRRFIVVRRRREFCYACPIFTYSGRATKKPGVQAGEHGIAYSWGQKPQLLPGETGITKKPIVIVMAHKVPVLDPASRIYFGIHHPIQYNVKVKEMGYVPQTEIVTLIGNWMEEESRKDPNDHLRVTMAAALTDIADEDEPPSDNKRSSIMKPLGDGVDPNAYHPKDNNYGYHPTINPHMWHPRDNPDGYHPEHNTHGYHPASNPYSYHPKHNPYGYHPHIAPFCYHPMFSAFGYHNTDNSAGYHPKSAPSNYHPDVNPLGWHESHNVYGYHPTFNQYGYHPNLSPLGYHPKHNSRAYHPTMNPQGEYLHGKGKGKATIGGSSLAASRAQIQPHQEEQAEESSSEESEDGDEDAGVNQLAHTLSRTTVSSGSGTYSSSLPTNSPYTHDSQGAATTSPSAHAQRYAPPADDNARRGSSSKDKEKGKVKRRRGLFG